jgi:ABC-type glycerol-3-phosphate transport system substrate-binding protein
MKKAMAGILAAAMTMGTMIPAAAVSASDVTTVSLWIPTLASYTDDAVATVEEAINAYMNEKYGVQIDLQYIEIGNFEKAVNLAMTTDEVDVTCYFTDDGQLSTYVANGQLLDITDYFEGASDALKETFTDAEITASSMNGRMYGLVRKYQYGGNEVAVLNKDIAEELGIDAASITTMDQLEEVLYQAHEAHPEIYTMVPQSAAEMTWGWAAICDRGIGLTGYAYADWGTTELKSLFETDGFAEFCGYTNKWYNDGLIMADALSNTMEGSTMVTAGSAFCTLHNADIDPLDKLYPNTVVTGEIAPPRAESIAIGNLQYGISANSAHPDESFTVLEALYTDPEFATLLSYGIEGEHYVLNDKGRAEYPEGMTAENEPYGGFAATAAYPDFLILPVKESALYEDAKATVEAWDESVEVYPSFGFFYDTTEMTDFVTAYMNLQDKYMNACMTGSVALDDVLPQIKSELESIGFYEVLADTQAALDEFLANK